MRASCVALIAGAAAIFASLPAQAETGTPLEIVRDHIAYDVAADGSYVERQEKVFRILSQEGLEALHQVSVSYTEGYQDASIEQAYTLKADGTRIEVPQNRMFVGYGLTSGPGFHDQKTRVAVFQNVEVGDEVGYVTVFRQKTPWYAGQFFTNFVLTPSVPLHDFDVTFTVPQSLALRLDTKGLSGGPSAEANSARRWSFTYDSAKEGSDAYLIASTFADFPALARAYDDGARDKAVPTPEIKALADKLTAGTSDKRQIVRKLYDWVSDNIKYVSVVLGNGALVPHFATDVLHSGYGDCKDHVTLLQALLSAKGIRSSPALIDLGPTYALPAVASPEQFDHVITYIPEFDVFLDSTARFVPFGVLPKDDIDKPVLITVTRKVGRTPTETAKSATLDMASLIHIGNDGTAKGELRFSATGSLAVELREKFAGSGQVLDIGDLGDHFPETVEGKMIQSGSGDAQDPYSGTAHYSFENAASLDGPGAVSFETGFRPKSLTALLDASLLTRQEDYTCASFSAVDDTTVELPKDVTIAAIPRPARLGVDGVTLSIRYERISDHAVRATMALTAEHPHINCTANYYNRIREGLSRMAGLLNAQIVYVPHSAEVSLLAQQIASGTVQTGINR